MSPQPRSEPATGRWRYDSQARSWTDGKTIISDSPRDRIAWASCIAEVACYLHGCALGDCPSGCAVVIELLNALSDELTSQVPVRRTRSVPETRDVPRLALPAMSLIVSQGRTVRPLSRAFATIRFYLRRFFIT